MAAKERLTAILAESLAERGFRRRGDSWHRLGPDLYSVVHLQPSRWDSSFYLNLGFAPADRVVRGWLPESKCLVRFRVEAIKKLSPGDLRLLNGDAISHMGEHEWRVAVGGKVVNPIVEILDHATDLSGLRNVLQDQISERVMVHAEMRKILSLQ